MSLEHEQENDPETEVRTEEGPSEDQVVDDSEPEQGPEGGPDLDAEALAAAEDAITVGEEAIGSFSEELDPASEPSLRRGPSTRDLFLRSVLVINLLLMGVMLVLPRAPQPSTPAAPTSELPPVTTPLPVTESPATQDGPGVPVDPPPVTANPRPGSDRPGPRGSGTTNQIWSQAFMLLGEGRYDDAAEVLLAYERNNPRMLEGQKLDLYTMLSTCLFKAGRMEEAQAYRAKANSLVNRGYLSEDLRDAARKAWNEGRADEARRYYARFLLQEKQLTPALRQSVPEAYLRIGDSYRMAADVGAGEKRR